MNVSVFPRPVALLMAAAAAAMAAALLPPLIDASTGGDAHLLWWAVRSSGFVAYVALALSMLFGVMVPSRGLDGMVPRKAVLELHQQWTLAAVLSVAVHVATVIAEPTSGIGPVEALVPFAAASLTGPLALGIVALWGLVALTLSSWLRSRMSYMTWRAAHGFAFGAFVLALAHSVAAGTDTQWPLVQWLYLVTAATVGGATAFRFLLAWGGTKKPAAAQSVKRSTARE